MDLLEFRKKFKKHFPGLNPNYYVDSTIWLGTGKVAVDVIKLDDWLHVVAGEYEEKEGMNMAEALEKYVSKEASEFIRTMLYS